VTTAALVPLLLVANGVHVLAHGWFVRFEYDRAGFPADPQGMPTDERTRLALVGLRSILPWEREGTGLLREARLADGSPAFGEREVSHMDDVRVMLFGLFAIHAVGLLALAALASIRRTRPLVSRGLQAGAAATLALGAAVGVVLLLNPIWFLTGFHTVFFEGSSWRFADGDTLRRLYPDAFWSDTATILGVAAAVQATALLAATSWPAVRHAVARLRAD
jgi:hypothetical protein